MGGNLGPSQSVFQNLRTIFLHGPGPLYKDRVLLGFLGAFFIFAFFKKKLQKYILGFRFYRSIPLPPGRGRQGAYCPAGGAAGSLLKYKTPTLPSAPLFSAHEIQRGERERGGVREVKKTGEALQDF